MSALTAGFVLEAHRLDTSPPSEKTQKGLWPSVGTVHCFSTEVKIWSTPSLKPKRKMTSGWKATIFAIWLRSGEVDGP